MQSSVTQVAPSTRLLSNFLYISTGPVYADAVYFKTKYKVQNVRTSRIRDNEDMTVFDK